MTHDSVVPCPGCGKSSNVDPHGRIYVSRYDATRYHYHHCKHCDLEFWSPLRMIPAFYEQEGIDSYESFHAGTRPFPHWALPFFEGAQAGGGLLLDVGCGDGAFLERAATWGFAVQGIDLDKRSVSVARTLRHLPDIESRTLAEHVDQCKKQSVRYDVITFFEVLEHQDDPMEFLRKVTSLLVPGGRIAGSVPNRERFLGRIEQRFDAGDLPPHHFLWFSAPVLQNLLARANFQEIVVFPSGQLDVKEIKKRLARFITRTLGSPARRLPRLTAAIAWIISWPLACVLWIGLRRSPRHLYFQARWQN